MKKTSEPFEKIHQTHPNNGEVFLSKYLIEQIQRNEKKIDCESLQIGRCDSCFDYLNRMPSIVQESDQQSVENVEQQQQQQRAPTLQNNQNVPILGSFLPQNPFPAAQVGCQVIRSRIAFDWALHHGYCMPYPPFFCPAMTERNNRKNRGEKVFGRPSHTNDNTFLCPRVLLSARKRKNKNLQTT